LAYVYLSKFAVKRHQDHQTVQYQNITTNVQNVHLFPMPALSLTRQWSMITCWILHQLSMRRRFNSSTSRTGCW